MSLGMNEMQESFVTLNKIILNLVDYLLLLFYIKDLIKVTIVLRSLLLLFSYKSINK